MRYQVCGVAVEGSDLTGLYCRTALQCNLQFSTAGQSCGAVASPYHQVWHQAGAQGHLMLWDQLS
jgi:hypothetical protein